MGFMQNVFKRIGIEMRVLKPTNNKMSFHLKLHAVVIFITKYFCISNRTTKKSV